MDNILTKRIQTQLSSYFLTVINMTKPETRCLKDMVLGILKSKSVFVNQIATSLREPLKLKNVCKRLSSQYLKDDYASKVMKSHLENISGRGVFQKTTLYLWTGQILAKSTLNIWKA